MRSVASKSLGSITVMRIVLDLGGGAGVVAGSTGSSGDGAGVMTGTRVDRTFFLASLSWPFAVARLLGRCLDIKSAVRPGQEEKFPALMAEMNVLGTGQKAARW